VTDSDNVHVAQRIFRTIMNAFSHPLKTYSIQDEIGDAYTDDKNVVIMRLCEVFLDNTVSFYSDDPKLTSEIREMTYAENRPIQEARFVVFRKAESLELLADVFQGSLVAPHEGATIIYELDALDGDTKISAEGPGINGITTCSLSRQIAEILNRKSEVILEYPMGFELLLATRTGEIIAVPRHVTITTGEVF